LDACPFRFAIFGIRKADGQARIGCQSLYICIFVSCKADGLGLKIPLAKNPDANGMFFRFSVAAGYQNPAVMEESPSSDRRRIRDSERGNFFCQTSMFV